jgi:hypothetical protein
MTPRIVCGIPLLIAAFKASEFTNAWGPSFTSCCHISQSTGVEASVADLENPETVPGARVGLIVDGAVVVAGEVAPETGAGAARIPSSLSS